LTREPISYRVSRKRVVNKWEKDLKGWTYLSCATSSSAIEEESVGRCEKKKRGGALSDTLKKRAKNQRTLETSG